MLDSLIDARDIIYSISNANVMRLFLSRNRVSMVELRRILDDQQSFDLWWDLWVTRGASFASAQLSFVLGELFTYYRRHISKIIDHVKTHDANLDAYMGLCAHWSWYAWQSLFDKPWI